MHARQRRARAPGTPPLGPRDPALGPRDPALGPRGPALGPGTLPGAGTGHGGSEFRAGRDPSPPVPDPPYLKYINRLVCTRPYTWTGGVMYTFPFGHALSVSTFSFVGICAG